MLPPYCCWLVGVCAVPGNDGPPNMPGGVPWERSGLRRRRAHARRSGRKPHAINHNVGKLRIAQDAPEPCPRFRSHWLRRRQRSRGAGRTDGRAAVQPRRTSASYRCAPLLPGFKLAIVFSILSLSVLNGSKVFTRAVVTEDRCLSRGADHGLREDDRGFLDGGQKWGDARAGFKDQHDRNLLSAQIEGFDRLVHAVIDEMEVLLLQVENGFALGADHDDRGTNQSHAHADRAFRRLVARARRAWGL